MKEYYQVQETESIKKLILDLNNQLGKISQRLKSLDIPQSGITTSSTAAQIAAALTDAGIVEE